MIDLIEQFRVEKLDVIPFLENNKLWDDTLKNCSYIPVAYSAMNINFVFECQNDKNMDHIHDKKTLLFIKKSIFGRLIEELKDKVKNADIDLIYGTANSIHHQVI